MLDLQTILDNAVKAQRAEEIKTSPQFTLGELISKLETINDKNLPVFFDGEERLRPTSIGSWRGSYRELALSHSDEGTYSGYSSNEVEWTSQNGEYKSYKTISTTLSPKVTVAELLDKLQECIGKTFVGYKGGDFLMGKTTPVWVADYSMSSGPSGELEMIVGVLDLGNRIVIQTKIDE